MCKLIFGELSFIFVSDIESKLPAPSFTLQTLQFLQSEYQPERISILMGDDQLASFTKWNQYLDILDIADLLVVNREIKDLEGFLKKLTSDQPAFHSKTSILPGPIHKGRSSHIRPQLQFSEKAPDDVTSYLHQYIRGHGLYEQKEKK